ncbi:MAG: hypothetical protein A2020_05520 [Lentisphaerae bacterium GWF2_45_14]|nr:MAG: hypothetical protein A2020_05520 [Lentisphaerae bacterium GWF2_45_14]
MFISKILCNGKRTSKTLTLAVSELKKLAADCGINSKKIISAEFRHCPEAEGYSARVESKKLIFGYMQEIDALYAVYDFASDYLGYCFWGPGKSVLAPASALKIEDGLLFGPRKPLIKRRGFIQEFPFNKDSRILADWMAKNKLNYLLVWMKYYDKMSPQLKQYFNVRGIEIESGHHNFSYWIPGEKYARSNPDFFAMKDGERIKPSPGKSELLLSEQLCTTNPELRREIVKRMAEYRKNNPEVKTLSLIPNDGFGWCECEKCSKFYDKNKKGGFYSVSEHVYKAGRIYHDMVADVASQLSEKSSGTNLTLCAYVNYCAPSPGFKLKENMAVHFAPYWRCINHSVGEKSCYTNSSYLKDLKAWLAAKKGGEVNIYEYYMGVNLYLSLPMVHHEQIFEEAALYHKLGVDGLLTQFHLPHWTAYGLNFYMMAKACWNSDSGKQEIDAAFNKIFGAKASDAKKFYRMLRKLQESAGKCLIPYPRALLLRTKASDYRKIHDAAKKLAAGFPEGSLPAELPFWTEYLLKFKTLFDDYHNAKAGEKEIEAFIRWCKKLKHSVLVEGKLDYLFGAWLECLKSNKEWLHFNLDWEDDYIRRHDKSLN